MNSNTKFQNDSKAPLYLQLTEEVRNQIKSGALKPGDRLPSIADLMRSYGFSKSTIERAHQILEQENIVVRKQGQGTFVTEPMQKPRYIIAVSPELLGDQQSPYWFKMLQGICAAAQRHEAEVIFSSQERGAVWERANGILVTSPLISDSGPPPEDFPLVSLLWPVDGATCVVADDYSGAYQLTEHLIGLGHRRIAFLYKKVNPSPITEARLQGYHDALRAHAIDYDDKIVRFHSLNSERTDDYSPYAKAAKAKMEQWLQQDWRSLGCTAILAHNDGAAFGVIEALREARLRVPQDVSVTGFDGAGGANYFHTSLTTIHVPLHEIGASGVDLMVRRLAGDATAPERTEIGVTLVEGESTGPVF